MAIDSFINFVYAFGAARALLRRAHDHGSLIEGMALYASLIDGFLRIGLVLTRQIKKNTPDIDEALIKQSKGGQYFTERQIYRMAQQEGVIGQDLYDELGQLYDRRNDIIHKFFLTNITYQSLAEDLLEYEKIYSELYKTIYRIEEDQIRLGVGMTSIGGSDQVDTIRRVLSKIDPASADGSKGVVQ